MQYLVPFKKLAIDFLSFAFVLLSHFVFVGRQPHKYLVNNLSFFFSFLVEFQGRGTGKGVIPELREGFFLFFSNAKIKETNGALFASQCRFSLFFLFLLKIPSFVIVISLPLDFGYCYDMSTEYSVSCFIESCICVHIISNAMRYF